MGCLDLRLIFICGTSLYLTSPLSPSLTRTHLTPLDPVTCDKTNLQQAPHNRVFCTHCLLGLYSLFVRRAPGSRAD